MMDDSEERGQARVALLLRGVALWYTHSSSAGSA
jgi:hypothetical protein